METDPGAGRRYFKEEIGKMLLRHGLDPETATTADIHALPRPPFLRHLPFNPEYDSEVLPSIGLRRLSDAEILERHARSERFLKMTEVRFPAEETAN